MDSDNTTVITVMHWLKCIILVLNLTLMVDLWALCLPVNCWAPALTSNGRKGPWRSEYTALCIDAYVPEVTLVEKL